MLKRALKARLALVMLLLLTFMAAAPPKTAAFDACDAARAAVAAVQAAADAICEANGANSQACTSAQNNANFGGQAAMAACNVV